uniref:Protein kinase domain-containing protein n=1 Tax=Elaeophora elaphi TaxID=1147741 RepID=A0A0R3RWR3_9BILA
MELPRQDGLRDMLTFLCTSLIWYQMPCCYLLPYVFNVHVLLGYCQFVTAQQRFERHALPTDHIVMFLRANRSTDGHSYMEYRADRNVNLIFSSGITEVNAFNGQWAQVTAVTWQLSMPSRITVSSNVLNGLNRLLHIISVNDNYKINITIFDAQMQMRYGNITVQITSDYQFLRIKSELYTVNLKTIISPFKISISDYEMMVQCENEQAIVHLLPNSSNIIINTNQYSRVAIDRGRDAVVVEGQEVRPAGNINLLSMQLKILLKSGNISSIHASTNRSQITVQAMSTNMASTAAHHAVDIIGGRINLHVFTGNVSIDIVANTHVESLPTMLTPFPIPQNNFQDITMDNFNHNFSMNERNKASNKVPVTSMPITMASSPVSDESSDFQAGVASTENYVYENIPDIKSTGTISLVFPERSSANILTSRTTLRPLNSVESSSASHSGNTSHTSFISESTKTEQIGTPIDTFSWPKVEETTAASSISRSTSTTFSETLSTLWTIDSSRLFSLAAVTSSMFSSSPTTIPSAIPVTSVKTLTSNRTSKIIIGRVPVTSRISQPLISTSKINPSGDITAVTVFGKNYPEEENRENVQTDFIEFSWDSIAESKTTTTVIATTTHADTGISVEPQKVRSTECFEVKPPERENTPLLTKGPTVMTTLKETTKQVLAKTNRSIGSAWTPFTSSPFEFPPTAYYPFTVSFRNGNFIAHDNGTKSGRTFDTNEISTNMEWNKRSNLDVPSVPMINTVKEISGKIVRHGSQENVNQHNRENLEIEFGQQQNFFSNSKFKRALSSFENGEIYELQLKIPLDINLTAVELHRELLIALKKFVLFTSLHEGRLPIDEDAVRIKITNMERNGEYLKVLYSVFINAKINAASSSAQKRVFSGADLLLMVAVVVIVMLFHCSTGALLMYQKQCYKFADVSVKNQLTSVQCASCLSSVKNIYSPNTKRNKLKLLIFVLMIPLQCQPQMYTFRVPEKFIESAGEEEAPLVKLILP